MEILALVISSLVCVSFPYLTESPLYYLGQMNYDKLEKSLSQILKMSNDPNYDEKLLEIKELVENIRQSSQMPETKSNTSEEKNNYENDDENISLDKLLDQNEDERRETIANDLKASTFPLWTILQSGP